MSDKNELTINNFIKRLTRRAKLTFVFLLMMLLVGTGTYYLLYGKTDYVPIFSNISMQDSGNIVAKLDELDISDYKIENGGTTILVSVDEVDRIRVDLAMSGLIPEVGIGYEIFDNASFAITDEDRKIMYQRALEGEIARSIMSMKEVDFARVHIALSEETLFSKEVEAGNATVILDLNSMHEFMPNHVKGIVALVSGALKNIPPENISIVDTDANLLSDNLFSNEQAQSIGQSALESLAIKQQFEARLEKELKSMLERTYGTGKIVINVDAQLDLNSEEMTIIEYSDQGILKNQQDTFERLLGNDSGEGMSSVDSNVQYYSYDTESAMANQSISNFETMRNYEIGETKTYKIKAPGEVKNLSTAIIFDGDLNASEVQSIKNIVSAAIGIDESRGDFISVEGIIFDHTYEDNLIVEFDQEQAKYLNDKKIKDKYVLYGGIAGGSILLILIIILIIRFMRSGREIDNGYYEAMQPIPVKELEIEETMHIKPFEEQSIEKGIKAYAEENPAKLADLVKTWMLKDEG